MHRNYAGLCSLVDQAFARILWALEASGQAENTIVVHTTDHGEMLGAHSLTAKSVMYEEATHVPFPLRVPFRNQRPMHVKHPVSHIDVAPTLLELLGKDAATLDGRSLVPALTGKRPPDDVFLEWTADRNEGAGPSGRTVITPDGWKLVLHDADLSMLFDRSRDPFELRNVYGQAEQAAVQNRLRAKIDAWQRRTNDKLALPG
ncbi:MAG: sulfatase-like hydrolase/transferase [Acidobacteria bacterium]|nr:sulfatase-like hydrolase/transferase [Acidobacteriota bacterium]